MKVIAYALLSYSIGILVSVDTRCNMQGEHMQAMKNIVAKFS